MFFVALLALAATSGWSIEADRSPEGVWTTIDDDTGQPHGVVELFRQGEELRARIVRVLPQPGEDPEPLCVKCEGERKGQPVAGLVFLWGMTRKGDTWADGEILDPKNGQVYSARMRLSDDGRSLEVRGYIGTPLFGRTQVWRRGG